MIFSTICQRFVPFKAHYAKFRNFFYQGRAGAGAGSLIGGRPGRFQENDFLANGVARVDFSPAGRSRHSGRIHLRAVHLEGHPALLTGGVLVVKHPAGRGLVHGRGIAGEERRQRLGFLFGYRLFEVFPHRLQLGLPHAVLQPDFFVVTGPFLCGRM